MRSNVLRFMPPGMGPQLVWRDLVDRDGDGDVWSFMADLTAGGLTATSGVTILQGQELSEFFAHLAEGWRGWQGERVWESMERDLRLVAVHDGIGHVRLRVTLRGGWDADAWSASATLRVDAGEDMRTLARNVAGFLTGS